MMELNFLEICKDRLKLDFTKTLIHRIGGIETSTDFEISPRDFLRYAKSDFSEKNEKGLINSLSNAKRAVDCQIDTALSLFGIDFESIDVASNEIVNYRTDIDSSLQFKLKLTTALDFAPSSLISNLRGLRNKLEHFYKKPSVSDVKDSIELAELFILAVESKTKLIENEFVISDKNNFNGPIGKIGYYQFYQNYIDINLKDENISITINDVRKTKEIISLNQKDPMYYFLIYLMNNLENVEDFKIAFATFLKYIKHPLPEKHIKVSFEI